MMKSRNFVFFMFYVINWLSELLTAIITDDLNKSGDGLRGEQPINELTAIIIGNKSLINAMAILNVSGCEIPGEGTASNKFN